MIDWFQQLRSECHLEAAALRRLDEDGFSIIESSGAVAKLDELGAAYDDAMGKATELDKRIGRTTTRVRDLLNRGEAFDSLVVHRPVLAACCHTIREPFKLSALVGRTLHARSGMDDLHVDFARDEEGWPMLGFILMIDEFTSENGATQFWPGSHHRSITSSALIPAQNWFQRAVLGAASSSTTVPSGMVTGLTGRVVRDDQSRGRMSVVEPKGAALHLASIQGPENASDPSQIT